MTDHEKHMNRCIELARQGEGRVSPNPLVGAVVLDRNGNVVGEGYHEKYGEAHAEINALNKAGEKAIGGTLYVNLEPCCHYGKTPPCIDRVLKSGIKTLVLGMTDPNPKVAGKSIKMAKDAGIEIVENVLNAECLKLNEIFIKNIIEKKVFVSIKTASTIDGKIATSTGQSKWITSKNARAEVHRLRNKYDAILTGSGTVLADNPSLTCRMEEGRNPVRIVIDSQGITSSDAKVYNNDGTRVIVWKNHDLEHLFNSLYEEGIYSVLIEAGTGLNSVVLKKNLADKIYFFIAPKIMGDKNAMPLFQGFDVKNLAECLEFKFGDIKVFSPDVMMEGYLK
ncbi:MAG: riboflavin biosynthesis protein RibD [Candidatus Melainabacteria bacterium GWF2_37_15]|nr:MAG: riboflavin biosynthesis protein RibD [Candidatus Melainabacteria bacterium GWF2_37_15]